MNEIKAVFFDYDGVLAKGPMGSEVTARSLAEVNDLDVELVKKAFQSFIPKIRAGKVTEKEIWPAFCEAIGMELSFDELDKAFKKSELNKDMLAVAKKLKKLGLQVGIITDNSVARTEAVTKKHKLGQTFSPIISGASVGFSKGGPYAGVDVYFAALRPFKLRPHECIFIEDSLENLEMPEDIGFHTYLFDTGLNDIDALRIYLSGFGIMV